MCEASGISGMLNAEWMWQHLYSLFAESMVFLSRNKIVGFLVGRWPGLIFGSLAKTESQFGSVLAMSADDLSGT